MEPTIDPVKAAIDMLTHTLTPTVVSGGCPFVVVPKEARVVGLEEYLPKPNRIAAKLNFTHLDAFTSYVTAFKGPTSTIFIDTKSGQTQAVLDYHGAIQDPSWCSHVAVFQPSFSEEWKRWTGKDRQGFNQREFALFLEDNSPDIVEPSGGEILDVARTLTATQTVNFKKGVRLDNGTEQLHYEESIDAKVGAGARGSFDIPAAFTLAIPVFEGRPAQRLEARLRYQIRDAQLSFHYVLVRPHKVVEVELLQLRAAIAAATKLTPFYGATR